MSDDPVDCMEQPASGLALHGLLKPAFIEEHSVIQKHVSGPDSVDADKNTVTEEQMQEDVKINGHGHETEQEQEDRLAKESGKDDTVGNGFAYYKLETIRINLFSAQGRQVDPLVSPLFFSLYFLCRKLNI